MRPLSHTYLDSKQILLKGFDTASAAVLGTGQSMKFAPEWLKLITYTSKMCILYSEPDKIACVTVCVPRLGKTNCQLNMDIDNRLLTMCTVG